VSVASSYIHHALEGRLRVKSALVKGSWQKAREVEAYFQHRHGITAISANPTTGSVLFHYDSQRLRQQEILDDLSAGGYLAQSENIQYNHPVPVTVKIPEASGQNLVTTIVTSTVETALQLLVHALI
jgi:hypothetical protein